MFKLDRFTSAAPLMLLIASLLPLWAVYTHSLALNDDTYITLTFAKNLAAGNGFVFNHPPAAQGTTTPLLTLIIAALAWLIPSIPIPQIAAALTAICWALTGWLFYFYQEIWGLKDWQAGLVGTNVIITSSWIAALGMEVYLFAFLLVLACCLFYAERYVLAGLCGGLLFITRGEGIAVAMLLCLLYLAKGLIQRQPTPSKTTIWQFLILSAGCALPMLLWVGYAYITFEQILPSTLAAKQAQGESGLMGRLFHDQLLRSWIFEWGANFRLGSSSVPLLWWGGISIGLLHALFRGHRWLIFAVWGIIYAAGYSFLQVSAYGWYQYPMLFILNIFFALGVSRLLQTIVETGEKNRSGLADRGEYGKRFLHRASITAASVLVLINLFYLYTTTSNLIRYGLSDLRYDSYLELSQWINENTQPNESIAYIELGYLGFYTENPIVDMLGLFTPEVASHIAKGDFSTPFWQAAPAYYIDLPSFGWITHDIKADERFLSCYQPIASLDGIDGTESEMTIFKRSCVP